MKYILRKILKCHLRPLGHISKMKTSKIPSLKKTDNTAATTTKEKAETRDKCFGGNFTDGLIEHIPNDSEGFVGELRDLFVNHPEVI